VASTLYYIKIKNKYLTNRIKKDLLLLFKMVCTLTLLVVITGVALIDQI